MLGPVCAVLTWESRRRYQAAELERAIAETLPTTASTQFVFSAQCPPPFSFASFDGFHAYAVSAESNSFTPNSVRNRSVDPYRSPQPHHPLASFLREAAPVLAESRQTMCPSGETATASLRESLSGLQTPTRPRWSGAKCRRR